MHRFKIGDAAKNLQVAMNPTNSVSGSNDKLTNSITYKNIEIKVSFVVEVSVSEKIFGVSNTGITITNDEDEIFKAEDDKYKLKAKAKGILKGYVYKMKNAMKDEKIHSKLKPAFKKEIEKAIGHLNGWLEYVQNPQSNENEIKKYLKRNKQEIYDPVIAKIKQLKQLSSST